MSARLKDYDIQSKLPVVYAITNTKTAHVYVGGTKHLTKRRSQHFKDLEKGKHHSKLMQEHYDQHGKESFELDILQTIKNKEDLLFYEQKWIDLTRCYDKRFGYNNLESVNGPPAGYWSKEHLIERGKKISVARGTIESRKKTSDFRKGKMVPNFHFLKTDPDKFPNQKLNIVQVLEIHRLYNKDYLPESEIAKMFNVTKSHIRKIVLFKKWKHLKK